MTLRFYFDQHVPRALAVELAKRQVDVLRTQVDGTFDWPDERILERATQLGRIVFTHDRDFLRIATEHQRNLQHFAGVVFAKSTALSLGKMLADLELIAKTMHPDELADQIFHLPI